MTSFEIIKIMLMLIRDLGESIARVSNANMCALYSVMRLVPGLNMILIIF